VCESKPSVPQEKSMKELFARFAKEAASFHSQSDDIRRVGKVALNREWFTAEKSLYSVFRLVEVSNQSKKAKGCADRLFLFFLTEIVAGTPHLVFQNQKSVNAKRSLKTQQESGPCFTPADASAQQHLRDCARVLRDRRDGEVSTTPMHFSPSRRCLPTDCHSPKTPAD